MVFSIVILDNLKIDEPVGAISVHGSCGLRVPVTNDDATIVVQLTGAAIIFIWVFTAKLLVWSLLEMVIGFRVAEDKEFAGMEGYPEFTKCI